MALLQVIRGLNPGQQFPIEGTRAVLGRHPNCDIVLEVGAISRQHAAITNVGGEYYVEDLKSRNGTFVNGELVRTRHKLNENDRLKICDVHFTFHFQQPGEQPIAAAPAAEAKRDTTLAMLVEDAGQRTGTTIMSSLDMEQSRAGVQLTVNPEVKLQALLEITRNLGSAVGLDEVLGKVLDSLFKIFIQADRGFVVLQDAPGAPLVPKTVKHRSPESDDTIRISRTVVAQVMEGKKAILSADAATDARFETSQSIADFRIRSMMCAPLVDSSGRALGVIQIDTLNQRSRFNDDDLEVLAAVACQAAVAVENAQLHELALRRQVLERDLDLAHKVQQGFLPHSPPQIDGYHFFDFYDPANQIGGDLFDYVPLPAGRLGVVLADVSGKGIPAALLMAKISSEARYMLASEPTPALAMSRLNASFSSSGWEDRFVTAVLAVIDLERHEVTIVNAGHMAPLLRRTDGKVDPIAEQQTGVPLGVDGLTQYEQYTIALAQGETMVVFTDGISEAMNEQSELYGMERIARQIRKVQGTPAQLGGALLDDVKRFVGNRPQSDDMCLICFGRDG